MKKLYIVYLPKKANETLRNRKILKVLEWYSKMTKYKNCVISSPGYMSTIDSKIKNFLSNLSRILTPTISGNNSNKVYFGLLNGMNGGNKLKNNNSSIIQYHNSNMGKFGFIPIKIKTIPVLDHRKVMCFFTPRNDNKIEEINGSYDIKRFLNNISVNAVLIGSSNQSNSTYFDDPSKKGEADIFMFIDEMKGLLYNSITENRENNDIGFEDTVITESVYGKGNDDPESFLKDILEDLLNTNIE